MKEQSESCGPRPSLPTPPLTPLVPFLRPISRPAQSRRERGPLVMPAPHTHGAPVYADADSDDGMVDNPVYIGGGPSANGDHDPSTFMVSNPAYESSAAKSPSHSSSMRHRAASVLFEPRGESETDDRRRNAPSSALMVSQRTPHSRLLWLVAGAALILAIVALAVAVSASPTDHSCKREVADMMESIADLRATVASLQRALDAKMDQEATTALVQTAVAPLQRSVDAKANRTAVDSLRTAVDARKVAIDTSIGTLQSEAHRLAEQIAPWPGLDLPALHFLDLDYLYETRTNTILLVKTRFPLPSRLLNGEAALRITGHIHARAGSLDKTTNYFFIDCFDEKGVVIDAVQVYRLLDSATQVLSASADGMSLTLALPASSLHWEEANMLDRAVALYIGVTTRLPIFVSSLFGRGGNNIATVSVRSNDITVTFNQPLPQNILAAVGDDMTAMVHFSSGARVYPVEVPVNANQEADVSFDVTVAGSCFAADPGCNNVNHFRPETAYFEIGFLFNYRSAGEVTVTGLHVQVEDA